MKLNISSFLILLLIAFFSAGASTRFNGYPALGAENAPRYFSLNFKDVEISEFVKVMSHLIGKNIIIDESVRGKITITSAKKVPIDEAFDIMKSILEMKGLAVVESENLIKIIPIAEAVKKNVEVIVDGEVREIPLGERNTITFLLELKHAEVQEVAATLKPLKSKFSDVVVYRPLNTVIISGTAREVDGLVKIARALDRQVAVMDEGDTPVKGLIHVIHLNNASAEELAEVLSRVPFSEYAAANPPENAPTPGNAPAPRPSRTSERVTNQSTRDRNKAKLAIIASPETNSIIVTASPDEFREIRRIIKELDTVREQVLIEALIMEVDADRGWSLGIDWMLGNQSGMHLYGGSSIMGGAPNYSTPSGLDGKTLALPATAGFQLGYLNDTAILSYALLNASGTDSDVKILQTPQILTMNNREAEINVGEEIAVPTNNRITDTGTQYITYDYKSVGVKLKITPHITRDNTITLDLYQEVNSVIGQTQVLDTGTVIPPTLGKRDLKTKISVHDGKTIVIGGLIRNNRVETETKVPILGDIPLLGWFFKRKSVEYSRTNLLIFITPHVVTEQERLEAITREKMNTQDGLKDQ